MKTALLLAAALVALVPAAAHAEKWLYYPVPGGAMGYDDDSRKADVASGHAVGDTLIYHSISKAVGPDAYSFLIMRLEFDCRANTYKLLGSAYFDDDGAPVKQTAEAADWLDAQAGTPPAVFKRIICDNAKPPTVRTASSKDALVTALKTLPITTELDLKSARAAAPPAIKAAPPPKGAPPTPAPAPKALSIEEYIAKSAAQKPGAGKATDQP
jgi:hypothetical protein